MTYMNVLLEINTHRLKLGVFYFSQYQLPRGLPPQFSVPRIPVGVLRMKKTLIGKIYPTADVFIIKLRRRRGLANPAVTMSLVAILKVKSTAIRKKAPFLVRDALRWQSEFKELLMYGINIMVLATKFITTSMSLGLPYDHIIGILGKDGGDIRQYLNVRHVGRLPFQATAHSRSIFNKIIRYFDV